MKIRGNTIGTTIRPERVLTKPNELTEEQKKQARENIGAISLDDLPIYEGDYTDIEDNPLPIEISTEAEMTALLDTADIGSVYKYAEDAEDSGTYEKGALYIVEAVEE